MKMTKKNILFVAILAAVGAISVACSNDDLAIETLAVEQPTQTQQTFTATVQSKAGDATTRSVNESGVTTWVVNEQIALYYQKTDNTYGKATATVTAVNDGKAAISASLTDAKDGGTLTLVYPASLVNDTGNNIDETKIFNNQVGTLADISTNFDAAKGTATLATDGTTCGTTETISLTNQLCICKFTLQDTDGAAISTTKFLIGNSWNAYTVTLASAASEIYVAMMPTTYYMSFSFVAFGSTKDYVKSVTSVKLDAGKFYNSTLMLTSTYKDGTTLTYKYKDAIIATLTVDDIPRKYAIATANETYLSGSETAINTKRIGGNTYYTWEDALSIFAKNTANYSDNDVWRLPTKRELEALNNLGGTWQSDPAGLKWTIGSASLLLPAAGYCSSGEAENVGLNGRYWSSVYFDTNNAYILGFSSGNYCNVYRDNRTNGFSVRLFCQLP